MKKITFLFLFFATLIAFHPLNAQRTYCDTACTYAQGDNVNDGNMFEVEAVQEISINNLWVITYGTPGYIKIYYKLGTYIGYESTPSAWTMMDSTLLNYNCNQTISLTLPLNIYMPQGSTISFYVTGNGGGMQLDYQSGNTEGNYIMGDGYVNIREGKGVTYPFIPIAGARDWCGMVDYCLGPTAIAGLQKHSVISTAMPNPFSTATTIRIDQQKHFDNVQLSVYDGTGRLVRQENNIVTPTVTIDREGLPAGIYFYKIVGDSQPLGDGKLIVE